MNSKIKNYVEVLFNDAPKTKKAMELKEEMLGNLNAKYDEYIAQGMTENQAYTKAVSELGDIDEMLASIMPEQETKKEIERYRQRKAKNIAIAVMLYIIGAAVLIACAAIPEITGLGDAEVGGVIGLILLLCCAAAATGLIIYTNMSVPQDIVPYLSYEDAEEARYNRTDKGRMFNSLMKLFWTIVVAIYLCFSFFTGSWGFSWLIFVIAGAIAQAMKVFFDMKYGIDKGDKNNE